MRDLKIALEAEVIEVKFRFDYDSLLKLAIAICAANGLRVKAKTGHHIVLVEKLSIYLKDQDIQLIGNEMRNKRNFDLYGGGSIISKKEADDYLDWLKSIFKKVKNFGWFEG